MEVEGSFRRIYDHHYPIMQAMKEQRAPIPKPLATAAEFTINADLREEVESPQPDIAHLQNLVDDVKRWRYEVDKTTLGFIASRQRPRLHGRVRRDAHGRLAA